MKVSKDCVIALARTGCEQAVAILNEVENATEADIAATEYFYDPAIELLFYTSPNRKRTIMGMPAMTPERLSTLVGAGANRA